MFSVHMAKLTLSILTVYLFVVVCSAQSSVSSPDEELIRLRNDWAVHFLEPEPHMELAKYFRDKGNLLQAFFILENARRGRFEQKIFDAAFLKYFGGSKPLDNSKSAEDRYIQLATSAPADLEAVKHLADIYISREDYTNAKKYLSIALAAQPNDFDTLSALVEIYERERNPDKAQQLLETFERRYPDSSGGLSLRLSKEMKADPVKARSTAIEAIAKFPAEGEFRFNFGVLLQKENKLDEAEASFVKAAELSPTSSYIQAWVGRFFFKARPDNARALRYYLQSYLLDPHAYETEYVESRIPKLAFDLAQQEFTKSIGLGLEPEKMLDDTNPIIVQLALLKIAEKWDSNKVDIFVRMMGHDEVRVRWFAMQALVEREGRAIDPKIRALLTDKDLRKRGLAAYMAVRLWKQESFAEMRKMLAEEAQILRFDAVSALVMEGGGEGRLIVVKHKLSEPNATLRKLIDSATAAPNSSLK